MVAEFSKNTIRITIRVWLNLHVNSVLESMTGFLFLLSISNFRSPENGISLCYGYSFLLYQLQEANTDMHLIYSGTPHVCEYLETR